MCLEKYWELSWILLILFWILRGKIARASILVSTTIFDMNLIWTQTPQSLDFQNFKSLDVLISMFSWSLSYTIEVSRHLQDLYCMSFQERNGHDGIHTKIKISGIMFFGLTILKYMFWMIYWKHNESLWFQSGTFQL